MAAAALLLILLAVSAGLAWEARRFVRWRGQQPPRWDFTSCWFETARGRIVAEGVADPGTLLFQHFTIVANGRPIEMVVMELTFTEEGTRWAARDAAGLKAEVKVH